MNAGPAVLVMARAPWPGTVKTRLTPMLGAGGCARLQASLIRRTAALAETAAPGACYVAFDPPDAGNMLADLVPAGVALLAQRGADLGQRMAAAADDVFELRAGPLVVVGTDVPTLTAADLRAAFDALAAGLDLVLGPARDGGYYLVGLSRPLPGLFAIDPTLWGGDRVLAATVAAAADAGLDAALLDLRGDLDTPADAWALLADPLLPGDIAALLTAGPA